MTDEVVVVEPRDETETTEQVEKVAEASVEVAKIEADRDVEIARIQAEASEHAVDVAGTIAEQELDEEDAQDRLIADMQQELSECRTQLSAMAELVGTLSGQVSSIQEQLTPAPANLSEPPPGESVVETQESQEVVAEPSPRRAPRLRSI